MLGVGESVEDDAPSGDEAAAVGAETEAAEAEQSRLPVPGLTRAAADEWALVLLSQGIPVRVERELGVFVLSVAAAQRAAAENALAAYRDENLDSGGEAEDAALVAVHDGYWPGLIVGLAILGLHFFVGEQQATSRIAHIGSANALEISRGEWWRCVTALCLHADWGHALSNSAALLFFMNALGRQVGAGAAFALIVLAGTGGNALNAMTSSPFHSSIGASTSVFGAVGLLSGLAVARRQRQHVSLRRAWLPVGAGLALLAMLGTGGERVDLWAHFYGLLVGSILGLLMSDWARAPRPDRDQWRLALATTACIVFAWNLALR